MLSLLSNIAEVIRLIGELVGYLGLGAISVVIIQITIMVWFDRPS